MGAVAFSMAETLNVPGAAMVQDGGPMAAAKCCRVEVICIFGKACPGIALWGVAVVGFRIKPALWWESWAVSDAGLRPSKARITGNSPGMDPVWARQRAHLGWMMRGPGGPICRRSSRCFWRRPARRQEAGICGPWAFAMFCHILGADSGQAVRLLQSSQCDSD